MTPTLEKLFSPLELGGILFPNRIARSATHDSMGTADGYLTSPQLELNRQLAHNQIGMLITAHMYISLPWGKATTFQTGISDDRYLPGLTRLCQMVHETDCKVIAQLNHAGASGCTPGVLPAPSDIWEMVKEENGTDKRVQRAAAMTAEEIQQIPEQFAAAALRARQAGFDGVQIHMAHGYLLSEFVDPTVNRRTDCYGGRAQNRFRLPEAVIQAVQQRCGPDYPVFIKINSNIPHDDAAYEAELRYYLLRCRELGVAAAELSGWDVAARGARERNYYLPRAARLRRETGLPMILVGGIRTLEDMAAALDAGVDMVSLSRPLICEPDLIPKLRAGGAPRCVGCNRCFTLYEEEGRRCALHEKKP